MNSTQVDQQAADLAEATAPTEPKRRKPGRPPGSGTKKKAGKKKSAKKKTSKKKTSKKTAGKKKASKKVGKKTASKKLGAKKASKKKRGKKKTVRAAAGSDGMARLLAAVEELREAVVELASEKAQEQQSAVADFRQAAQQRFADLEDMAVRTLKKLGV